MSIKMSAFMNAYKYRKTQEEKEQFIISHIKDEYIPYETKADVAKAIVNCSYWRTEKGIDGVERKVFYVDSVAKYMLTCMSMIDLFTDIERSKTNGKMLDEFNKLNSAGIFDVILQNINKRELNEFNMVLDFTCRDVIANEYENHAFISKQVDRFGNLLGAIIAPVLEQLDVDKIRNMITSISD